MGSSSPVLAVANLRKVYAVRSSSRRGVEDFVAVDDVSFELGAGESLAVVGESGSGKSTCARLIVGLESPTSGTVNLPIEDPGGRRKRRTRRQRSRHVQMVFQDPYSSLDPSQTVHDSIAECLNLHHDLDRLARSDRIAELLSDVGLDTRHAAIKPRGLSGGERQRVAIAKALAAEPRVLVLDEAVAALDVSIQAQILNVLADVREKRGISMLFISHDLAVVEQISTRVIVMRQGAIVEQGHVADVLGDPQHGYTRRLIDSVPRPGWVPRRHVIASSRDEVVALPPGL